MFLLIFFQYPLGAFLNIYKTKIKNFIKVVNIPKYVLWDNGVTDFGSFIAAVLFCILGKLPWKNIYIFCYNDEIYIS